MSDPTLFRSNLREVRTRRGLSQSDLAQRAGVSRQAVTSIESGVNAPSAIVALKLAHALGLPVEDLFWIEKEPPMIDAIPARSIGRVESGPVTVAWVDGRWIAHPAGPKSSPAGMESTPADGEGSWHAGTNTMRVTMYCEDALRTPTGVVAGCAPALSVWTRAAERWRQGMRFQSVFANSAQALDALMHGEVHAAGVHLYDTATGQHNAPFVNLRVRDRETVLVNVGKWIEGLFVPPGNPLGIRGVEDLARPGMTLVNREQGAGSRQLIESLLDHAGIPVEEVAGFERVARSHHEVAQTVAYRQADVGVGPESIACRFGLDFIPLQEVRYDVVVWKDAMESEPIRTLIETLNEKRMRAQLRALGGFDTTITGEIVARVGP